MYSPSARCHWAWPILPPPSVFVFVDQTIRFPRYCFVTARRTWCLCAFNILCGRTCSFFDQRPMLPSAFVDEYRHLAVSDVSHDTVVGSGWFLLAPFGSLFGRLERILAMLKLHVDWPNALFLDLYLLFLFGLFDFGLFFCLLFLILVIFVNLF